MVAATLPPTPAADPPSMSASADVNGIMEAIMSTSARTSRRHTERGKRRIDRGLLMASFAIAAGLFIVGYGVTVSITGDEGISYPDAVERVDPVPSAVQVPNQTGIFVDLEQGYTGVLVVNGVEIPTFRLGSQDLADIEPGRQIDVPPVTVFEPGNATLSFTPTEGALVESFDTGIQQVDLIYWREVEGRQRASTFTWTFNVV